MALKLITEPGDQPITLESVKTHLRLEMDFTDEDGLILELIKAAREYVEGYQNRLYGEQIWELILDSFPSLPMTISKVPLISVESITYKDSTGVVNTFNSANYLVDAESEPGRIVFVPGKSWPSVELWPINAVRIRFKAGVTKFQKKIKQAMKLLIGYWYDNREAAVSGTISREIEFSVRALLGQDRRVPV